MSRVRRGMLGAALGLTACLGGCQSTGTNPLANWPWMHQAAQKEEYQVPPMQDTRYTDAQTYPKETMQAILRNSEGEDVARRATGPGSSMVGPMRQTAAGRY